MDQEFDLSTPEGGMDFLEHYRWKTGLPWQRWLINRRRRKEGRPTFTH